MALAELLIAPVTKLLEKVIPDLDERNRLAHEISTLAEKQSHEVTMGQLEVAKVSAAHKSMFVAGARPFILWICGIGLGYNAIVYPIMDIWWAMPPVDKEVLYPTLFGVLGLGGYRSFEKVNGVARER